MFEIDGERLRHWLTAAGMTQAQLARYLHVDAGQVSRWTTGKAPLRADTARQVITLLRQRGLDVQAPTAATRVFLSTPMAALDSADYAADRAAVAAIFDQLTELAPPVYWAAGQVDDVEMFEAPDLAVERNLAALRQADAFVYVQLRELTRPTSCHVEIGMAVASRTPVTIFAPSEDMLPYGLRHFEAVRSVGGRFRFYAAAAPADAVRLLTIHGLELLGLPATTPNLENV